MHSDLFRVETFQLECRRMYRMIRSPRNDDCLTEISRAAKTLAFLTSRYYARTKSFHESSFMLCLYILIMASVVIHYSKVETSLQSHSMKFPG